MPSILVIHDDPQKRREVIEILSAAGHETLEAKGGREGLSQFRAHRPPLVVTAIVMSEMDGLETITALRGEAHPVAIIAIADGYAPRSALYVDLAKGLGADEAISAPFSASELSAAVARLL